MSLSRSMIPKISLPLRSFTSISPPIYRRSPLSSLSSFPCRKYSVPTSIPKANLQDPKKREMPILGVAAALKAKEDDGFKVKSEIFGEFAIPGGVAVVTGANGGLGLEMALTLCELGCTTYALDLPSSPSTDFLASQSYATKLSNGSSLHYSSTDVTSQPSISSTIDEITSKHGRLDAVVAAAGILGPPHSHGISLKAEEWRKVYEVNATGVFFTAQAAVRNMKEVGSKGSVVLIASMSGSLTNRSHDWVAYNSSKSAVLQIARSLACEVGADGIRVNSISPGHIYTKMTAVLLDEYPEYYKSWSNGNPLGRLGQVHELRGVTAWLASSASSFCTGSDILVSGGHHAW